MRNPVARVACLLHGCFVRLALFALDHRIPAESSQRRLPFENRRNESREVIARYRIARRIERREVDEGRLRGLELLANQERALHGFGLKAHLSDMLVDMLDGGRNDHGQQQANQEHPPEKHRRQCRSAFYGLLSDFVHQISWRRG